MGAPKKMSDTRMNEVVDRIKASPRLPSESNVDQWLLEAHQLTVKDINAPPTVVTALTRKWKADIKILRWD